METQIMMESISKIAFNNKFSKNGQQFKIFVIRGKLVSIQMIGVKLKFQNQKFRNNKNLMQ